MNNQQKTINNWIPVDEWEPTEQECIINNTNYALIIPVGNLYGLPVDHPLNLFIISLSSIRVYNKKKARNKLATYLNYFINFYDLDGELMNFYSTVKYNIDYEPNYSFDNLMSDINMGILGSATMINKINNMNEDNYMIDLDKKEMKLQNQGLVYTNVHGKLIMKIALIYNMIVPLAIHYCKFREVRDPNQFMIELFKPLLNMDGINLYAKLYETASTKICRHEKDNTLWKAQDIRGINTSTHIIDVIDGIIVKKMCGYVYCSSPIAYNKTIVEQGLQTTITDVQYEVKYNSLSSSNRDEDNNSDFDKFESTIIKQDESLFLQIKVDCRNTLSSLENMFGHISNERISKYKKALSDDNGEFKRTSIQEELIFNLFYKYFGIEAINNINMDQYIKLMIWGKEILLRNGLIVLPYILSGKVIRVPQRKNMNKREIIKIESSPEWHKVCLMYQNPKHLEYIQGLMASIINGEFSIVDEDPDINGIKISCTPFVIYNEILKYILLLK